jgi:DNA-binding CsgD family transcriptional regulator
MAHPELSERELQVLQYLANGKSNKEIGQTRSITESTVKSHLRSILTKLEAMGRTEAIAVPSKHRMALGKGGFGLVLRLEGERNIRPLLLGEPISGSEKRLAA